MLGPLRRLGDKIFGPWHKATQYRVILPQCLLSVPILCALGKGAGHYKTAQLIVGCGIKKRQMFIALARYRTG
jgi:hypothetical protein